MESIATSLDKLQGEKNVSIGCVMPCLFFIRNELKNAKLKTTMSNKHKIRMIGFDMQNSLIAAFEKRFSSLMIFNESNRGMILASVTHPVYKTKWITNDSDKTIARSFLEDEFQRRYVVGDEDSNLAPDVLIETPEDDEFLPSNVFSSTRTSVQISPAVEIYNFWENRDKSFSVFKDYPRIGKVFRKTNTTLSASSPVERLFSQALLIFTPRRNRLSHSNFEKILLTKHNNDFCKE